MREVFKEPEHGWAQKDSLFSLEWRGKGGRAFREEGVAELNYRGLGGMINSPHGFLLHSHYSLQTWGFSVT